MEFKIADEKKASSYTATATQMSDIDLVHLVRDGVESR